MHQHTYLPSRASLVAALVAVLAVPSAWAVDSGSTGADGAFSPTVNTEVQLPPDGILNYTTVNIPAGVTVTFKRNTANTPVYLLASGNVTIAGIVDLNGRDGKHSGTYGDGVIGDDGIPGDGSPGGFSGGRGGRNDEQLRPAIVRGGAGLGPGGGPGGIEGANSCIPTSGYVHTVGVGGGHASIAYKGYSDRCAQAYGAVGKAYGSSLLQPLIGGSGGGGGKGGSNFAGSGGGGGGGAILLASSATILITGTINAIGGDAGGAAGGGTVGAGGSGGAIRIVGTSVTGSGKLKADGGCVNADGVRGKFCGNSGADGEYGGSVGRIRIEGDAIPFTGTASPAYVAGKPGPIFIANSPSLRIASVAGSAVPANPTGINDVTLPATTTGPVEVVFATTNVPTGNTVTLRVVPAYGTTTEALSPAIAGSSAEGTTSVSVTLPQGPSTLQATTTYTVVVAMQEQAVQEQLKHLADNEAVETVEILVALEGGARATLHTVSGKAISLPYETLAAVGFKG